MGENEYKISLGVDIDVGDLQSQINKAGDKVTPIPIKVEIENLAEIKKQIQSLGKSDKNALTLDTTSLENSLRDVKGIIADIKASIGTLDSKSGMKSLLSSINSISTALDKASGKFDELNAELKSLSGKDFNINFGINMGGSNQIGRNAAYGSKVRNETLPQLKQQMSDLVKYYNDTYKSSLSEFEALQRIVSGTKLSNGDFFENFLFGKDSVASRMSGGSLASQMQAYKQYIDMFKQAASLKGLDISHITSGFSKSADQLVQDAVDVQTGANEMQEGFEKLRQIFGGNNNFNVEGLSQQLDSIVVDLGEIKTALQGLSSGISVDGLTQSFDKLSNSIEKLVANVGTVKTTLGTGFDSIGSSITEVDQKLRRISDIKIDSLRGEDLTSQINNLKTALNDFGFDKTSIDIITKDLEEMRVAVRGVTTSLNNDGSITLTVKGVDEYERAVTAIKKVTLEAETGEYSVQDYGIKVSQSFNKVAEAADRIKNKLSGSNLGTSKFDDEILDVTTKFGKLSNQSEELKVDIDQLKNSFAQIKTAASANDIEALIVANQKYEEVLRNVNSQLKQQAVEERNANDLEALKQNRANLSLQMDNWLKDNSAAAKQFGGRIKELQAQISSCDKQSLARLRSEFAKIKKEAQLAGKTTQTFGDKLKAQFSKYSSYFSVASLFMYASQGLRDMFRQVVAIDTAMTELKKVTDETDASYNKFLSNAASRSKELGTTIDGLVESTADFARLGYGFEESQGLAEVANIYAVVGDEIEGVEDATKSLISTLAAYKDEASGVSDTDFAMDIVDKFNEVSNNFAISSGGIGEAMQRSASSLRAANNTIDESIALITAANTVVQDPTVIGTSFKTISMRIRGAKTELEEAGLETEGMVESTATLRAEIEALSGVDIMEADGKTFKSTYAILDELAQKWEDLSDIQQATVTELIAGKRQGNVISSLMQNFDIARDALETSLNSSGSAMKEHEKWQQSLEARINKLKSTWQSLSQTFMSSDFLKSALDAVIGLVNGLDKLIDTFGLLPTLLTTFTAFKSFSGKGFFRVIEDEAAVSGKRITSIFGASLSNVSKQFNSLGMKTNADFRNSLQLDMQALNKYRFAISQGMDAGDAFNKHLSVASEAAQNYAKSGQLAAKGITEFGKQQKAAQVTMVAQNNSLSSAKAIMLEYNSGCKNTAMSQQDFVSAVNAGNSGLGKYLSGLNGAKASMGGYITSLIGAKVASFALQAATMALNAALTMGISALITWAIQGIDKLIKTSSELAEEVEEVTTKFKEQHDELLKLKGGYNTSDEDSMISRYEKLSKGVDNLGRNISLTADEYSEYQSIVNKIADQIPSLVSGYDSQGNAILSCKDNVEELAEAYEKLIHAQNQAILTETDNIEENYANNSNPKNGLFTSGWSRELENDSIKILEDVYKNGLTAEEIKEKYNSRYNALEIMKALNDAGIDTGTDDWWNPFDLFNWGDNTIIWEKLAETYKTDPTKIKNIIDDYYGQFDEIVQQQKIIAQAKLSEAFDISSTISGLDYGNISEDLQAVAYQVVGSLDKDFFDKLQEDGKTVEQWTTEMLNQLNSIGKDNNAEIEAAFDLQTQFNGGEIPFGDYVKGLEDTGKLIDGLNLKDEVKSQLKLSLGLDENGLVAEYKQLKNRLADSELFNIMPEDYEPFLEGLSAEELSILVDIIPELSETDYRETIDDVKSALKLEMMKAGLTFDLNLEIETAGIEALNTALAESVSATGLSSESITALKGRYADLEEKGYDLSVLFEETSHGIHLNRQEFNKLEKAYATDKLADVNGDLEEMKVTYDDLGEAIKNTDDPIRKAELYNDRQTLAKRISEAATLAAQYEGLTSAYNDWLAAEEAGQERDMYENVIEGFENIGDEISRGWYDDATIEFLEMLTGRTDLAGKSAKQLKEIYDNLDKSIKYIGKDGKVLEDTGYSVRDFFTVDDEGNSTADGVYNFLDAIGKLEEEAFGGKDVVKRDKNGKVIAFDFELAAKKDKDGNIIKNGDEAIAEALGISEELVQIMKRAADDAGFVVSMDGTYKQLADLQNEARESAEYLKSIGKTDFDFDFNTTSLTSLNKQLDEAHKILEDPDFWNKDGTFNFNAKGATQAMQVVSTLQAKVDKLTEEKYGIGLTVEDEEFEEPLENLQEYGRTVQTLNQLKLNPKANAEEIESLNDELNDIAEYFANLDGETKVKLGFEADDGIEEVKKKIESGEIEIPTVLDIQTNMDKNLETLADLALLNSGLLSDKEEETIEKKYKIEAKADEVDTSDVEEKVESAVIDGLGNPILSREANIKIIAETFGIEDVDNLSSKLEGLDDKTIQAIAEAVGKGDVDALDLAIAGMDGNTVQAVAEALGYSDVETLKAAVRNMQGNEVDAKVDTDGQAEKIWTLQDEIDGLKGKTVDIVTNIKKVYSTVAAGGKKKAAQRTGMDLSPVNGTANINGTTGRAYKRGSWGTKNSGTALVGELGREVLVRDGRYYTIGDNGAEFIKYQKGDIIFNHVQSEELFKNGKVTSGGGRAKAFAQGTAFDTGTGGGEYGGSTVGSNNKDKTEETFDWIETLISRLERTIDNLDQTVNNIYKSWSDRNTALTDEISEVGKLISKQESAHDAYMAEANKVGLDESWASKVRNGTIDINTITDENLAEKIKDYETWYEKALAAKDAIEDLKQTEAELYEQRFENIQSQYDGILQGYEHTESMLNEYISQAEAKGHIVSKNYYNALIDNEKSNIAELQKEQVDLIAKRDEAVASGAIVKGSQAWYDMCAEIDGVTQAIEEGATALIEYDNAIRDIDWQVFDLIQERISDVTAEADFLIDLMSYDKLFDDNGKLTDKGMATMGLHGQNYNTYMYAADEYANEISKLNTQIANGELDGNSQDVINRRRELIELQRESILAAEDEKQAIKDLVEEGINLELEALQERIDLHNEELDSMKDLYDYQNNVQEQTENIASLQKQLHAYEGFTDEETRATVQKLKVELESAQQDLQETEYDKYIADQTALLDELFLEYENVLNTRLDDTNALITQVIDAVNIAAGAEGTIATALGSEGAIAKELVANGVTIKTTLENEAKSVGATLSTAMKGIWSVDEGNAKSVLETYGKGFQDKQTTTNTVLGDIKTYIGRMVDDVDKDAQTKTTANKTSTSAKKDPTKNSGSSNKASSSSGGNKTAGGDGKVKIGDKVKFLSGKYYYDSQGVTPAGSKNHGKQVYITNINKKSWATHPYHISTGKKLGQGDLGWLKLNQISGYATGKRNFLDDEIAWTQENGQEFIIRPSDGAILTPIAKGDSVLTSAASSNIWDMANSPADFIKDNLNLGTANVPNNSTVQNTYTQNFENIVFSMPNVKNYSELLSALQKDPKFDKLIKAMTIDQIAGKSSLAKNKSIR